MSDKVLLAVADGVATITLNRPEVLNALDGEMMIRLRAVAEDVQADETVRAVLLRGAGPAFASGGDVGLFHSRLEDMPRLTVSLGRELQFAMLALRRTGKPVVARVHGAVAGAGMSLLAAADLAIAAGDTRFSLAYASIGTSPDGGATWFLPRLMGYKKAMELALMPDPIDAGTARALGLVNWVCPEAELDGEVARILARLADGPTIAYGETKALMNRSFDNTLETHLEAELQAFARCARTADFREGVSAFVERRKPVFKGH